MDLNFIKARKVGIAHKGSEFWFAQRFTSLLLALFSIWFIQFCYNASSKNIVILLHDLQQPYNFLGMILTVTVSLYHGLMGMQVIVEDYIHNLRLQYALIIILRIFTIITLVGFIVAMLYLLWF